jgi:hypothetical protein
MSISAWRDSGTLYGFLLLVTLVAFVFSQYLLFYSRTFVFSFLFDKPVVMSEIVVRTGHISIPTYQTVSQWYQANANGISFYFFKTLIFSMLASLTGSNVSSLVGSPVWSVPVFVSLLYVSREIFGNVKRAKTIYLIIPWMFLISPLNLHFATISADWEFPTVLFMVVGTMFILTRGRRFVMLLLVFVAMAFELYVDLIWMTVVLISVLVLLFALIALLPKTHNHFSHRWLSIFISIFVVVLVFYANDYNSFYLFLLNNKLTFLSFNLFHSINSFYNSLIGYPVETPLSAITLVNESLIDRVAESFSIIAMFAITTIFIARGFLKGIRTGIHFTLSDLIGLVTYLSAVGVFGLELLVRGEARFREPFLLLLVALPTSLMLEFRARNKWKGSLYGIYKGVTIVLIAVLVILGLSSGIMFTSPSIAEQSSYASPAIMIGTNWIVGKSVAPYFADIVVMNLALSRDPYTQVVSPYLPYQQSNVLLGLYGKQESIPSTFRLLCGCSIVALTNFDMVSKSNSGHTLSLATGYFEPVNMSLSSPLDTVYSNIGFEIFILV